MKYSPKKQGICPEWRKYLVSDRQFGKSGHMAGGVKTFIEDMAKIAQTLDEEKFLNEPTQELLLTPLLTNYGKKSSFGIGSIAMLYTSQAG